MRNCWDTLRSAHYFNSVNRLSAPNNLKSTLFQQEKDLFATVVVLEIHKAQA